MTAVKKFKELTAEDSLWFVDPKDKKIKPIPVKEVNKHDEEGFVNITVLQVSEDIAEKYEIKENIPTRDFKKIRADDNGAIVLFTGKRVQDHLPVPIFTSKSKLKEWLNQSGTKIISTKKH